MRMLLAQPKHVAVDSHYNTCCVNRIAVNFNKYDKFFILRTSEYVA
jgi:hypothetical protein